jgi:hypothetical protein
MEQIRGMTPAKRKRLLKTFGGCPAGYTNEDLERFLDLLYGLFSDVYTMAELRQMRVSDPFDRSDHPRQLRLVELTDWLEALVACDERHEAVRCWKASQSRLSEKPCKRLNIWVPLKQQEHDLFLTIAAGHR